MADDNQPQRANPMLVPNHLRPGGQPGQPGTDPGTPSTGVAPPSTNADPQITELAKIKQPFQPPPSGGMKEQP